MVGEPVIVPKVHCSREGFKAFYIFKKKKECTSILTIGEGLGVLMQQRSSCSFFAFYFIFFLCELRNTSGIEISRVLSDGCESYRFPSPPFCCTSTPVREFFRGFSGLFFSGVLKRKKKVLF